MISRNAKMFGLFALAMTLAVPAFAGKAIPVRTEVVEYCTQGGTAFGAPANCMSDFGVHLSYYWPALGYTPPADYKIGTATYSVRSDGKGTYAGVDQPNQEVISDWGTNSAVYSLNTDATAVDGQVGPGASSRGVKWHFFSPVEFPTLSNLYPDNRLPPCWNGKRDHLTTVNWNVFASEFITRLPVGGSDSGSARANFNIRPLTADPNVCDQQQARYRVTWNDVCITRLPDESGRRVWVVTTDQCEGKLPGQAPNGAATGDNGGTASLQAYGGRRRETISYGDWRLPFKLILTEIK